MNLTVGQKVKVCNPFQRAEKYDAEVVKLGRVYRVRRDLWHKSWVWEPKAGDAL